VPIDTLLLKCIYFHQFFSACGNKSLKEGGETTIVCFTFAHPVKENMNFLLNQYTCSCSHSLSLWQATNHCGATLIAPWVQLVDKYQSIFSARIKALLFQQQQMTLFCLVIIIFYVESILLWLKTSSFWSCLNAIVRFTAEEQVILSTFVNGHRHIPGCCSDW